MEIRLYVAPDGNDSNDGSFEKPFATLNGVKNAIRKIKPAWQVNDITVYLRGGNYFINEPVVFTPEDGGSNEFFVRYTAYEKEEPMISGGKIVTDWAPCEDHPGVFHAKLKLDRKLRQLYVNGRRAFMAEGKKFTGKEIKATVGKITVKGDEPWAYSEGEAFEGVEVLKEFLPAISHPEDLEMSSKTGFGYHQIEISDVIENEDTCTAIFSQPGGTIAQSIPVEWGCGFFGDILTPDGVSQYCFRNALEFLDTPGEFYFDRSAGELYYYPRKNEDMTKAQVIAPISEGLIKIEGRNTEERVKNLSFSKITFAHDHWSMMKLGNSHADTETQAVCMYTQYAPHRGMHLSNYSILRTQGAAIQVDNAENIIFDNNVIRNTGVIGIAFGNDVKHATVSNCVLRDIGSSAIVVGDPRHVYIGDGDYPEGVEGLCEYITLHKNIMKDTSVLSLQAPAITAIFGKHIDITNNFLENAAYTGISLGWGWVDFTSRKRENPTHSLGYNRICDNVLINMYNKMHDGAAIYTLGQQPHSEISGNIISGGGGFSDPLAIYLDQGSAYFDVHHNTYLGDGTGGGWLWIWGDDADVNNCKIHDNSATHRISDILERAHDSQTEPDRKLM